jgi:hypothetical protein
VRRYPFRGSEAAALAPFVLGGGWTGPGPELVAFGANTSPTVLEAKLGAGAAVSARPAWLHGFDAVFSAHVSPYGALPATLLARPGTALRVMLLRLAPGVLRALDLTEPNYTREPLADGLEGYRSRHGALLFDGTPAALAAVEARGRTLPALTEVQALDRVRTWLDPAADPDAFLLAQVRDRGVREARTGALRGRARPAP